MKKILLTLAFVFSFVLPGLLAQTFPEKSNTLVTDYTNTLNPQEKTALENKLLAFNDSSSTQIAIVMLATLDGYPLDDYARRLAQAWGIGEKKKNNGALILVSMKERKITIQVGYGLEAVIPDALAKRIIEQVIKPRFKEGAWFDGLDKGTDTMIGLARGEFKADALGKETAPHFPVALILIVGGIICIVIFSKVNTVRNYSNMNHISFWAAWALLSAASSSHSGRWNSFSSGGGIFGGGGGSDSGGGGFGGFGGGSFGGGGASGSW
jgi:uncharacterized protein